MEKISIPQIRQLLEITRDIAPLLTEEDLDKILYIYMRAVENNLSE